MTRTGREARGARRRRRVLLLAPVFLAGCGSEAAPPSEERAVDAAPRAGAPVIAVAGDIAGPGPDDEATAAVVEAIRPTRVLTTGDNVYEDGRPSEFREHYAPSWGRFRAITRPVPGNHDYHTAGGAGYFGYFGRLAGPRGRGYYSFDLGAWHLVALNSEVGVGPRSAQLRWLRRDLGRSRAQCTLAYWHRPRFSSGPHGDAPEMSAIWRALQGARVDVVLTGHDHDYQRFRPLDAAGRSDPRGIRQWVVGTGGRSHYDLDPDRRDAAANDRAFGVLRMTLRPRSYDFAFVPVRGASYRDAGRGIRCR